jgi:class 3 adenylate cyclase
MKFTAHAASVLKFWKSSVSRKMTIYFMVFGIIIFYATSVLYLMAFRQSVVASITGLIHQQFKQLEDKNERDFIWHSVNTHRPDVFGVLNAFINIAPDLYTINDVSIYCRVADETRWYRLYFKKDQIIHAEPAAEDFLKKLNRRHELPLILSNFHFFISKENLSLFQDISGKEDRNRYYLKVTLNRQGIGGVFKTLGVHISIITIILLFLTRLLGYLFSRKFAKPIELLTRSATKVANGDLTARIPVTTHDEVGILAENFNRMVEGLQERDLIKETFGKYVSKEIRDEILKGNIPLDGELKQVTVLFADLRNFTQLAENMPPRDVAGIINEYFREMSEAVNTHKGLVLQFIGDEIEAVFGAPLPLADHPVLAVKAALDMRHRLSYVNRNLEHSKTPPLEHGIGIHTGQVLAANIGSPDRLSYTLIGDTVNLASRIQELNKDFQTDILISGATQALLENRFELKRIGETPIRGKNDLVELYRVS